MAVLSREIYSTGVNVTTQLTAEEVFRLHPKIRWAGLANDRGEIVFSQMRAGVKSITTDEDDRNLLQLGSMILRGVAERSSPSAGNVQCITVLYEKFGQLIVKRNENTLILTVEKEDAQQTLLQIIESLVKIE
jgi:hypothetical protein